MLVGGERVVYDIVGDVHGELPALTALGREVGYDVDRGSRGRIPFFLGDLVDRGEHSLEVAEACDAPRAS
jgi:hypothetical protein